MSTRTLLVSLFEYKRWADQAMFNAMQAFDEATHQAERRAAKGLMNHVHAVDRIFAANLERRPHGFAAAVLPERLPLPALQAAIEATDRWYIDYVHTLSPEALAETIHFTFTDGQPGCMSREEMLAHVLTHGSSHRGGVGRLLAQLSLPLPADTYTAFLHATEPARRKR